MHWLFLSATNWRFLSASEWRFLPGVNNYYVFHLSYDPMIRKIIYIIP